MTAGNIAHNLINYLIHQPWARLPLRQLPTHDMPRQTFSYSRARDPKKRHFVAVQRSALIEVKHKGRPRSA
jgi:hypothetical protein